MDIGRQLHIYHFKPLEERSAKIGSLTIVNESNRSQAFEDARDEPLRSTIIEDYDYISFGQRDFGQIANVISTRA